MIRRFLHRMFLCIIGIHKWVPHQYTRKTKTQKPGWTFRCVCCDAQDWKESDI